jgi:chaperonin cofactor prefoldin
MVEQQKFQILVQELQIVVQQSATLRNQESELESTIELVTNQDAQMGLYQQSGAILAEVADRGSLLVELKSTKNKISKALSQLSKRESELRHNYEKLAKEFEGK